ncbi:Phosphopantetheine adenylyltransferase [Catalinimonas alkaloidigena]|uniref:Phosphopantetheine adenylyltransferase n=1 Tax=Catalinimonas alkaloidigena TaxID=1075417 RepID=A0A1G8XXU6_9BACT|nr:pantetheine-phosphate adenylyltransferase [Catalinimonas alkaloidigena]SDJ95316.1 Phosphopantetheine adenylyltransferase [Catalinimonas alkaloidigena]
MPTSPRIAIFPGSFDPFTRGHEDVVRRGIGLFDKVIIGIGVNSTKQRYFPLDEMAEKVRKTFADESCVEVMTYQGLTAKFAQEQNAHFLLRGLRNTTDFEYENAIAQANRHVFPSLETVFLITSPSLATISSSIVRDLHRHGQKVDDFVPYAL